MTGTTDRPPTAAEVEAYRREVAAYRSAIDVAAERMRQRLVADGVRPTRRQKVIEFVVVGVVSAVFAGLFAKILCTCP